ncbi:hypothetical protein HII36_21780 [Nonomuraea sp. NN258]|uniref:hypothetical protein n=1 Tax=Nonomuraea antri TaxID=2730852 RepID=UPI0015698B17|nr:hypothetical protein [Nonomuraea antri]NRQ34464.1 hypothetical protein [Nonomuraea antri]
MASRSERRTEQEARRTEWARMRGAAGWLDLPHQAGAAEPTERAVPAAPPLANVALTPPAPPAAGPSGEYRRVRAEMERRRREQEAETETLIAAWGRRVS